MTHATHSSDNDEGGSEASTGNQQSERKKVYRKKTRKKSLATNSNDDTSSENDQSEGKRRSTRGSRRSLTSPTPSKTSSLRQPSRGSGFQTYHLKRTLSSPTGLSIVEYLVTRHRGRRTSSARTNPNDNLPSCLSTPVKLANRQDSCGSSRSTGPKFLALGDGLISVEPRVRTSLSRGTAVRSRSVCFGNLDTQSEDISVNSFRLETEKLLEKFALSLLSRKSKKARKREREALSAGWVIFQYLIT